ncbi:MAG: protein translocase subunit SecD [Chloroflexi bacterium]|nr:protein translocase subunit SecD [Chloroflexota bacterium]
MRWVLPLLIISVFAAALVASAMPNPNPRAIPPGCPSFCPNLGLDLVGGLRGEYRLVATDDQPITREILEQTRTIIENRVNATGVAEPNVLTAGSDRITIELPGAADAEEIRRLVGTTGRLDFIPVPAQFAGSVSQGSRLPVGMPDTPLFSGSEIASATAGTNEFGQLAVNLELKETGARLFDEWAAQNVNRQFAIVLDGVVISAPVSNASRYGGRAQITGNFTPDSMNELVTVLRFGSLPLEIEEVGFSSLSATLGLGFLAQTVLAGFVAIAFVFAFMLIMYRLPGVIACIALLSYAILNYALFRTIPVTLTLAGIAGFVLAVGMAVDANILIFERTKEELRAGKPLNAAIEAGFNRAWSSIFDANVSSLMTAFILWYFGSSVVRGFALVLIIGIATSMFTAITLSRMMLRWVVKQPWARKASFYGVKEEEFLLATPRSRRQRDVEEASGA